jgi:uncharacterized protein YodC (DUF2158 family)
MNFEIGSKVVLQSDGPAMTVVEVIEANPSDKFAICNWFDRNTVVTATLPFAALKELA